MNSVCMPSSRAAVDLMFIILKVNLHYRTQNSRNDNENVIYSNQPYDKYGNSTILSADQTIIERPGE